MINRDTITICYLCGEELSDDIDDDHVPPRQIYASQIRQDYSPNLLTLPTHRCCNRSYQLDEDYFVQSMSTAAYESYAGDVVLKDIFRRYQEGHDLGLRTKILKEFEERPSGLYLPPGLVVKRIESQRIRRIAWKIIRGLFFYNEEKFLPENISHYLQIIPPNQRPPDDFSCLSNKAKLGDYPAVFDYKYSIVTEVNSMYYWAMLFWDRLIMIMAFHNPGCVCNSCTKNSLDRKIAGVISGR